MNEQFLLLLDGMMGAGKTTTTGFLRKQLPRTAIIGMDRVKKFISDFERCERDNTIAREIIVEMTKKYLTLGLSVIVEQPFWDPADVQQYADIAQEHSVTFHKFQLFTTPEVAYQRAVERQESWEDKVPDEKIREVIALFKQNERLGFHSIDTTHLAADAAASLILEAIRK